MINNRTLKTLAATTVIAATGLIGVATSAGAATAASSIAVAPYSASGAATQIQAGGQIQVNYNDASSTSPVVSVWCAQDTAAGTQYVFTWQQTLKGSSGSTVVSLTSPSWAGGGAAYCNANISHVVKSRYVIMDASANFNAAG